MAMFARGAGVEGTEKEVGGDNEMFVLVDIEESVGSGCGG